VEEEMEPRRRWAQAGDGTREKMFPKEKMWAWGKDGAKEKMFPS
jgi:hypothetical protein